ncbi:uncharacterized protein FOMMEDRAFT_166824 [Fomitiporia mediterranea MF3/22]|uniref:uncharacterized protein n=1 Tax=Fomitiporia mediterranea (strain MF3/22) TaxID=694068 RepID=UPI0004407AE8|nr:uncharacterized protein FOMMEDRAFT_166824 [Fomitiporia mediterranea MF3/22]EJD05200.1 hypothetical protein FOMMEDRAFT_166824 [Fomitiporia mediterranea MF3/22]
MQINPTSGHLPEQDELQLHKFSARTKSSQHGHPHSRSVNAASGEQGAPHILAIPAESLTHITAFLDPASLFALGRASKILHEHIDDDNTWHTAFACQFLGEGEETPNSPQSILLRRCEDTWKREFVLRCNLIRRWERCRNGTVSHTPHYSPVMAIYLLSDRSYGPSLLSVSLQYGIVARSFPLSGKVLKGYITSWDGFGLGNGNPNAEFTPNVTSYAVTSEGWTVRVAFGLADGVVALATVMRVMESARVSSRIERCFLPEEHRGPVVDLALDMAWGSTAVVSAGSDGEVRVWDVRRHIRCIYLLTDQQSLVPDACVHVLSNLERGIVLATKKSGATVIWTGLSIKDEGSQIEVVPTSIRIPTLKEKTEASHVFLDNSTAPEELSFGIHFQGDTHFYRVNVNLATGQHEVIRFGDGPLGPIQTIKPFFASITEGGKTVIFAGDSLGRLSLFDWSPTPEAGQEVSSFRRLDASSDGAGISAIACNPYVVAIGTTRGATKVYNILTLNLLREFPSPIPRPSTTATAVKQIILEKDLLLVAVGERILAWEAKPVRPHKPLATSKRGTGKVRNAKWHKRIELAQDISESRKAVEDVQASERRTHERRRAHHAALVGLGLDEHEALQYVLMVSRDEAAHQTQAEESVFDADFEDASSAPLASRSSSRSEGHSTSDVSPPLGPSSSPSASPTSVRASPSLPRQSSSEGGIGSSPLGLGIPPRRLVPPSLDDAEHFPIMGSSASSSSSLPRASPASASGSWSSPLKVAGSSSAALPSPVTTVPVASIPARRSVSGPATSSGPSLLSETLRMHREAESGGTVSAGPSMPTKGGADEEMDADLKLALELSLAEALSLREK